MNHVGSKQHKLWNRIASVLGYDDDCVNTIYKLTLDDIKKVN